MLGSAERMPASVDPTEIESKPSQQDVLFTESSASIKIREGLKELFETIGFQARVNSIIEKLEELGLNFLQLNLSDNLKKELKLFVEHVNALIGAEYEDYGYAEKIESPVFLLEQFKKLIDNFSYEANHRIKDYKKDDEIMYQRYIEAYKRIIPKYLTLFETIINSQKDK